MLLVGVLPASAQHAGLSLNYLNRLNRAAVEAIDVKLDQELLRVIQESFKPGDPDWDVVRETLSGLKGVYAKGFKFAKAGEYTDADLAELRAELRAPGWRMVAGVRNKRGGDNGELYCYQIDGKILGLAIISALPTELYVINLIGAIPLNRLSLREGLRGLSQHDVEWKRWMDNRGKRGN